MALTGFSTGRGRGGSHRSGSHGSSGGGCSSSSQNHDSSSSSSSGSSGSGSSGSSSGSSYDDDDSYGSGSTGSSSGGRTTTRRPTYRSSPTATSTGGSTSLRNGTARLISCADANTPYARVRVTNPNGKAARFSAHVDFLDASGITVTDDYADVRVPARGQATVKVKVGGEGLAAEVDHCATDREAILSN
ncbi:hypothetical protein GTW43_36205 [Streptomyces sp. SID5785]|nr:hypothetical protein [Streptomyces sp. SID5785]MZD10481.1 hypothetical protein [Streptomyces sp. SID5785]